MARQRTLIVALAASVLVIPVSVPTAMAQQSTTLNLASGNNSGITGTATLTETAPGKMRVEIRANGAGAGPQAAHIHEGTCANLNPAPKFSLQAVTNGAATSEVDGTLQQLTSSPHAIHMHQSADALAVNVACADITMGGQAGGAGQPASLPRSGDAGSLTGMIAGLSGFGLSLIAAGYGVRRRARRH